MKIVQRVARCALVRSNAHAYVPCVSEKMAQRSDRSTESSSQSLFTAEVEKAKKSIKYLSSLDVPERSDSSHSLGLALSSGSSSELSNGRTGMEVIPACVYIF